VLLAQTPGDDSLAQAMLAEIRQLRSDLQTAAATIQRVNIVMFRIETQAGVVEHATQRVDQIRMQCNQAQANQKMFANQVEQAEANGHSLEDAVMEQSFGRNLANLKSALAELAVEIPRCQAEQAEAENQLRNEQNRMNDLQDQLEKLDKALSAYAAK
jgi:chromosome segregation ATPase